MIMSGEIVETQNLKLILIRGIAIITLSTHFFTSLRGSSFFATEGVVKYFLTTFYLLDFRYYILLVLLAGAKRTAL